MRKIDLTNYDVEVQDSNGKRVLPYIIKEALQMSLYSPDLRLGSKELFDNDRVAQKISSAQGSVMLEEAEYNKLKSALETIKGYTKNDVEMLKRVFDAPEVTV
jgi:hypothetical protein